MTESPLRPAAAPAVRTHGARPADSAHPTNALRLAVVAAASIVAAVALPLPDVGIGWAVSGSAVLLGALALALPATGVGAGGPRRERVLQALLSVTALALLATGAVRAAGWVLGCAVAASAVAASVAVGRGRSLRGLLLSLAVPARAVIRGLPWAARSAAKGRGLSAAATIRLGRSLAVAALLLVVFGLLFTSADTVFAEVVRDRLGGLTLGGVVNSALFFLLVLGLGYALRFPPHVEVAAPALTRSLGRLDWVLPLLVVDAVFMAFVAVQVRVLFGGEKYVLSKGGPDYASYARSGFTQLLAVTVLTIVVIAIVGTFATRATATDRALIRLLVGLLGAMTLAVITSALNRTAVYAGAYGFTRTRLLAEVLEIWLGLVVVLVLLAGVRLNGAWLPRAGLAAALAVLCGLIAVDPDALMARTMLARDSHGFAPDYTYLATLSVDAVPVFDQLREPERSCLLRPYAQELAKPDPWYARNLSRDRARALLAAHPLVETGCCSDLTLACRDG